MGKSMRTNLENARNHGTLDAGSRITNAARTKVLTLGIAAGAVLTLAAGHIAAPSANAQTPRLLSPSAGIQAGSVSIPDLVEQVSPAVVSVLVEREVERARGAESFEEFFRFRFGEPFGNRGAPRGRRERDDDDNVQRMSAQGSGFFIDNTGHIVTNNHVIEGSDQIRIRLANGEELDAELVGADALTDLAVIKVTPPKRQKFVDFAHDVNLRVGETVVAVGNPFGLGGTVTSGIVSAIGGENRQGQFLDYIQIDAPINRGNSGGPTFDLQGRVVGVNTAIYSPNGGSVGIGFAIPARVARATVNQLIDDGSVTRGWLGVSLRELDATFAAAIGRTSTKGAFIEDVLEGTPAEKAGLRAGDLVLRVDGQDIDDTIDLSRTVSSYTPGEKVKVEFVRDGEDRTLTVELGKRGSEDTVAENDVSANDNDTDVEARLGISVEPMSARLRDEFRLSEGGDDSLVVTGVSRGGAAAEAGLRPGMLILQVDGEPVSTLGALERKIEAAIKDGKDAVLLRLQAGDSKRFAAVPIDADSE